MSREEFIKETKKKLCDKFDYLLAEADAEYISNFLWNEGYRMEEKWISTTEMLPEEDKSLTGFTFGDIKIITVLAVCNKLVRYKNRLAAIRQTKKGRNRDMDSEKFIELVKKTVVDYVNENLDITDGKKITVDDVYIVWMSKVLQNNKALASTTLLDGMYYELTYNGDKQELYVDAYKKWKNYCVKV